MSYSEKLRHPNWQKKRLEILQRDDFTCQLCGDTETELHVHHKVYPNTGNPWDVDNSDLVIYCKICHLIIEDFKKLPHIKLKGVIKDCNTKIGCIYYLAVNFNAGPISENFIYTIEYQDNDYKVLCASTVDTFEKIINMFKDGQTA